MAAEEEDVTRLQWYWKPFVAVFPSFADVAAMRQLNVHLVRSRNNFETAILYCCFVDGEVGSEVLDLADMVVRWCV